MESHDKMISMEKILQTLVKEVRKNGFFIEQINDNVKQLAEGQEVLDGKISRIGIAVEEIDERMVRVEMNQKVDKEEAFILKVRIEALEKRKSTKIS